jgi:glycosyltransferase involved in cell wall biosynthesis
MLHSLKQGQLKKLSILDKKIIIKGIKFLFNNSFSSFIKKTKSVIERESRIINYNQSYNYFLKRNNLKQKEIEIEKKIIKKLRYQPKISILMPTYNSPHEFLKKNIESVINQIYQNWELCIADDNSSDQEVKEIIEEYSKKDKRIKYIFRKKNGHISQATNSALKLATGKYISLLDHDDILYPNTLSECIKKLNKHPDADFIYTDEDKIDTHEHRFEPHFKPDWSPETLLSGNYITHFVFIKKNLINKVNGFRTGYEGAQDLDLFLRITELTNKIYHIPKVLYSWRTVKTSTATKNSNAKAEYAYKNGIKSVADALKRRGLKSYVTIGEGNGLYRYIIENKNKNIDFFILKNKNKFDNKNIIEEIKKNYSKSNIEESNRLELGQKIFNFIKNSNSDYILFLDNQCYLDPKLIEINLGFFKIKPIKIVTNKITDIYNKIYKTGIIIAKNEHINTIDAFYGMTDGGYFNFNYSKMTKNFSVTSLLGTTIDTKYFQSKDIEQIKNLNNLKEIGIFLSSIVIEDNNRIVYNPNLPIIYKGKFVNEQIPKNNIFIPPKITNSKKHDPNYNPNLTLKKSDFSINKK